MITIPTAEQEAFQSSAPKTLTLNFSSGDPLTNEDIYMESLLLEQSICEESNLTFGMVYSSHFSVRIFDTGVSYTNQRVNPVLSVTVDGTTYTRSLGYYTVKSDRLTSDKLYRDLECYDYLVDVLQTDFTSWHNQMPSTYTLGQYRNAFFQRIGLAQSDFTDILDDMGLIRFKVDELSGATVISAILQAYGVFGYLGYDETHNDWRFRYVRPSKIPVLTIDDNSYVQGSLNYEDEPIRLISGVKILGWSEDYGEEGSKTIPDVTFGDDVGSMLTIEDNYLIHSLEENPRQSMCHGIYNNVNSFNYYPTSVETPVWMGIEPGDVIKIETDRKDIYFPVFKRTLKGISALKDEYEAQGEYELTANASAGGVSGTGTSIEQMRESIAELLAQKASIDAQDAAIQANIAANSALTQLSIVEDVAGTLNWIREHGSFVQTTDTTVHETTIYFELINGEYVPIAQPDPTKNPVQEGWYILDVTSSQSEYIMAHLAVTSAGLWVLPFNALSPHPLVDSDNYYLVDSEGNQLVDWSKDPQHADGYKALFASDGMTIYNSTGSAVAHYGTTIILGSDGQSRLLLEPIKFKMINSVDDEIYSIEPGKRSEHQRTTTIVSYQDETEVVAHTYNIEDTGALDDVEPYTELTINNQTYAFSTGISVSVTEGAGVTVTITNDGVSAILSEMQYEDYDYVLTTDTTVNADKTYYQLVDNEYESVEPEGTENPSQEGWYEQVEVTDYYPCILSVVYLTSYVLTAQMDMRGQIEVTGEGNPVTIINEDWSDLNKTDTYFRATNKTKGTGVGFGIGAGGENHGIWSNKLKNWMIYANGSGAVTTRSSMILRENGTRIYGYGTYPAGKLYCFGNNQEILRFATKTTAKSPASKRGLSFMIANGYYAIGSGKTISHKSVDMYLCGGTDASGKYIRSYPTYARKYNYAPNMFVTIEGTFGRATSSSIRYKHDVEYLTNEENSTAPDEKKLTQKRLLKGKSDDLRSILDIPVVKFKFNDGYVTGEEDFDYTKPIVGLIADDVAKICPECATYIKDKDGNEIPESYNTNQLLVRMLYVMQQQEKRIQDLEERISILEGGD